MADNITLLNNKNASATYLPFTGGVMTGNITFDRTHSLIFTASESKTARAENAIIKQTGTTERVALLGGTEWYTGAVLTFSGEGATFNPGGFDFRANDHGGTESALRSSQFKGTPDGILTWIGQTLLCNQSLYSTIGGKAYKSVIGKVVEIYFHDIYSSTARTTYEFMNLVGQTFTTSSFTLYGSDGTNQSVAVTNYNNTNVIFKMTFTANTKYNGKATLVLK